MGGACRMDHKRLRVADIRQMRGQLDSLDKGLAGVAATLQPEDDD